jgi:peptidyl-prolyl cis-trans isomerase SurA
MVTGMVNAQGAQPAEQQSAERAEAQKKIQMIENHLDSGDDFATLAMNYSEDPDTSNNGGDLGMVPESQLTKNPTRPRARWPQR